MQKTGQEEEKISQRIKKNNEKDMALNMHFYNQKVILIIIMKTLF